MHRILFFGTSDFAVPSLRALHCDPRFEIVGIVTQPDRPVGRRAVVTAPAVKLAAGSWQLGIQIFQPEKLHDEAFASWIHEIGPMCEAFVVVSYGKILPQWLLDLPKHGVLNVHGSLLPKWRGPSPIQAAIATGDEVTGVTIMKVDAEMDHGPILAQHDELIRLDDTGGSLHDRLSMLGAQILPETLAQYLAGNLTRTAQDHTRATYCSLLTRENGKIDFTKSALEIERLIRAYDPWPGTWNVINGKRLKILAARIGSRNVTQKPGERFVCDGFPCIACRDGTTLKIERLQFEGASVTTGEEFIRGHAWNKKSLKVESLKVESDF